MIWVVGCVHDIQSNAPVPLLEGSPDVRGQRDHFRELLVRILFDERVELVAEEWGRESESFAQALAKKDMVRYVDINTSFEDLDALQIPRDYLGSPCCTPEQKQLWLRQRETFMVEKIRSTRGTADTVLVICGFDHLETVALQLGNDEPVVRVDYRKEDWYRKDAFFPACPS